MNRSQDTVIDDDEESCPLCIEEFDLSDKNFRPCPCGYQICQFCFNSLKTTYEKSTCPNCRRPYDESTIQYKIPTAEEFKLDLMNKNKKQAAAKRKETEKREVETSSRRNLAGVRVKQQNLVYVIGLEPTKKDESMLLDTLRGKDYFGQYGDIEKIVVSKAKPGATNQGIGVYVTFKRKEDAATCIEAVDGSQNADRILRAQYGTTKYCSAFLRGETCMNKNCSFLHETGEDGHHISIQNEPSDSRQAPRPIIHPQPSPAPRLPLTTQPSFVSQPMLRQTSRDTEDSRKGSHDGSALPPTAGWANTSGPVTRARRSSQVASRGTPSPQLFNATPAITKSDVVKHTELLPAQQTSTLSKPADEPVVRQSGADVPTTTASIQSMHTIKSKPRLDNMRRNLAHDFCLDYDDTWMTTEDRTIVEDMPPFYDLYGGAKRRLMEEKEVAEQERIESDAKAKLEAQATSAAEEALGEDQMAAGSLALGGEPEDNLRSISARGAIGQPSQPGSAALSLDQFPNLRSNTPQQIGNVPRAPGLPQPTAQNSTFDMADFDGRAPRFSVAQYEQISNHQRNGSRYFNNDAKPSSNTRFQGQQQSFYPSGIQGPPPGLPTAGTPPVSGGGMFAHGQGFTNTGFGSAKEGNGDMNLRGRSGTNTGHEMSKRGGVEHLADPSILQARIHQGGGASGQGLFGSNQVDEQNFPPLPVRTNTTRSIDLHSRVSSLQSFANNGIRSSTPKVPPGFENTHAHPIHSLQDSSSGRSTPARFHATTIPVVPALPSIGHVAVHNSKLNRPTLEDAFRAKEVENSKEDAAAQDLTLEELGVQSPKANLATTSSQKEQDQEPVRHASPELVSASDAASKATQVKPEEVERIEPKPSQTKVSDTKPKPVVQRPTKIEIPSSITAAAAAASTMRPPTGRSTASILDMIAVTPDAMSSRPATPATATSEISRASIPRPRTIRLTTSTIQKAEVASMASPMTEKSATLPAVSHTKYERSRQPSLSSMTRSRASTPSIAHGLMSQDVSRAGSPPPNSIVGSAPGRTKTKNQLKKDRREKAKKAEEPNEAANISAPIIPVTEPVGPIVARQKKQKRKATNTIDPEIKAKDVDDDTSVAQGLESKTDSPVLEIPPVKQASKAEVSDHVEAKPTSAAPSQPVRVAEQQPKRSYTVRDLCNGAANLPNNPQPIQTLLGDNTTPVSKLISEMLASGDLTRDHPWLTPPSFNSAAYKLPQDHRKGQDYLDGNGYSNNDAFGYVYLPQKEKRALYAGHAVSVADTGDRKNDLLRRCLITPNGWVMRHLSAEESERVLELEERRSLYAEEFGDIGVMNGLGVLESDDFANLGGGIDELGRFGDRHGVCWVMSDDAEDEEGEEDEDEIEGYDDDDVDEDDLLDELGPDNLSEETDEDLAIGDLDLSRGGGGHNVTMPGAWDPAFNSSASAMVGGNRDHLPPNTLSPIHAGVGKNINLRAMDVDALQKRIHEKQRELDGCRKDNEKMEKVVLKKGKEFMRWKEGVLKA